MGRITFQAGIGLPEASLGVIRTKTEGGTSVASIEAFAGGDISAREEYKRYNKAYSEGVLIAKAYEGMKKRALAGLSKE